MNKTPPTTSSAIMDAKRVSEPACHSGNIKSLRLVYPPVAVVFKVMGASKQTKAKPMRRKPRTLSRDQ